MEENRINVKTIIEGVIDEFMENEFREQITMIP